MGRGTSIGRKDSGTTYIISYPKSGRTWLRVMLGKALCDHYGLDERDLLRTRLLTAASGLDPVEFTHDGSALTDGKHWSELSADKSEYREDRVALLVRDPKDVIVSSYFQETGRARVYDGALSQFVRSGRFGIRKVVAFLKAWHVSRSVPREFVLLQYEDMMHNAQDTLKTLLDFADAGEVAPSTIAGAVEFARFENMRKLEQKDSFQSAILSPADPRDPESFKVRRGKVGGYSQYLTEDDVRYIDSIVRDAGRLFEQPAFPPTDASGAVQSVNPRPANSRRCAS